MQRTDGRDTSLQVSCTADTASPVCKKPDPDAKVALV